MKISQFIKKQATSAVNNIKGFVVNKSIGGVVNSVVSQWGKKATRDGVDPSGAVQHLLTKSPFEKTLSSGREQTKEMDPLGFAHIQYPPELTGEEMGNWILFLTITNNVGGNPAFGADFRLAEDLGSFPEGMGSIDWDAEQDKAVGIGVKRPHDYDTLREQYRWKGIEIPKIKMTNTIARLAQDKQFSWGGEAKPSLDLVSGAIALYMPPDVKVSYGAEWGPEDTNIAGDLSAAWKDINNSEKTGYDFVHEMLMHGLGIGVKGIKEFIGSTGAGAGLGDWFKVAGKNLGFAINNHREMFYEGPEFRTFNYQFMFWPRNADETERAQKIITMFKYHMHPWKKTDFGSRFFQYPSEFEIHYIANSGVNPHLNKISRCALTKCDVTYGPEGGNFKSFEETKEQSAGAPVTYKVDLQFKELEYMTKQTMLGGF